MFSRTKVFRLLASTVILLNFGCGLKIGEVNVPKPPAKILGAGCLEFSVKSLKLFFAGDATNDQVAESMQCLQDVFTAFKENIRGETKDVFTSREIATFIEANFLKDKNNFSDSFLTQVMKFKVALVGGNENFIHKTEIDKISNLIALIKPDFVNMNRSMKIITSKWNANLRPKDEAEKERLFIQAKADLGQLIQKLSREFERTGNVYQIDSLIDFAKEVATLSKADAETISLIEKSRPFIKKFKVTLIGGLESLQKKDWKGLGATLNEGLFQTLRIKYFLKDLKPEDSELKWNGYQKMASDFSVLIESLLSAKESQAISNYELFELFQTFEKVDPNFSLSLNLIESFGHFKVMLLGDSPSGRLGWSVEDFSELRGKLPTLFQNISLILRTYSSIHEKHPFRPQLQYSDFTDAELKITTAVNEIAGLVVRPYNLYYLKVMILELSTGPMKDYIKLPDNFESVFNVFLAIKTNITGQQDNKISVENLNLLLAVGSKAFFNYLEYDIFLKPLDANSIEYFFTLDRLFLKIKSTINLNLTLKKTPFYSSLEISQTLLTLQFEKFLNTTLTQKSLDAVLGALWTQILNTPRDRLQNRPRLGFDLVALNNLSNEVLIYLRSQKVLAEIFQIHPVLSRAALIQELKIQVSQASDLLLKQGLFEILAASTNGTSMTFNKLGFLKILSADVDQYQFDDVSRSNLARGLSRILIRSYADDIDRATDLSKMALTVPEGQLAYKTFSEALIDLKLIEVADSQFVVSRFREANLFLSISNGDALTNFQELHHLILHTTSGLARAKMLREKMVSVCLPPQIVVVSDETTVWDDCLLKFYADETEAFSDLPQFLNLRKQFSAAELKDFYLSLLKAAGHIPNDKKVVRLADANLFPHIVQYVETVFGRFDINQDRALDKSEALAAFPIYHDLIRDLVKANNLSESELPGVFIYLLKYGKAPKTLLEKIVFKSFINSPTQWVIHSTRLDLGKIFNYIAESTKP